MVAIITVNYNTLDVTIDCINSLLQSDYKQFKIFLIDNGSEQSIYQALVNELKDKPEVEVVRSETNRGYVGGVNLGLEIAGKENPVYFLIMNNDTIIDKPAITELVKCADKYEGNAIVSGKVYYYGQPDVLQHTGVIITDKRYCYTYYPGKNEKDTGQCDEETERDSLDDVFWLLPAKIVNDIGYYCDYYFMYAEQGDYAQKARRNGYKLIFTPDAKLWHKESMTAGGGNVNALPICYWRGKSSIIFSWRNLQKKYFIVKIIKILMRCIKHILTSSGKDKQAARARLEGYLAGIRWIFKQVPDDGYNPYKKV